MLAVQAAVSCEKETCIAPGPCTRVELLKVINWVRMVVRVKGLGVYHRATSIFSLFCHLSEDNIKASV
jgi:hypothetical protein